MVSDLFLKQVSLRNYNTLGIDARAAYFQTVTSTEQLNLLLMQLPVSRLIVLGEGSNVVFLEDFPGVVLLNQILGIELVEENATTARVKVSGGERWDQWVAYSLDQGWFGLENLSGIPGTVGAAPIQNIGAYGVEVKDTVSQVEAINLASGEAVCFSNNDCEFSYRDSIFKRDQKNHYFITAVEFLLQKKPSLHLDYGGIRQHIDVMKFSLDTLTPAQLRQVVIALRQQKLPDPKLLPNAGSFFKNPLVDASQLKLLKEKYPDLISFPADSGKIKLAAGWMIDYLGWKGRSIKGAHVHERQALVLINEAAESDGLVKLYQAIQADVKKHFDVLLEVEPNLIGTN